jgi:flagellar hook assembly protein FlgD
MDVDLVILDILGRQVARIALGTLSAGDHHTVWDGAGGRVSSGQYFYTLASGGRPASSVRPLVLLR